MRRFIGLAAGAIFGIAFVTHCSTGGSSLGLGDGMIARDGAASGGDGMIGVGDARGQSATVITANCDQAATTTTTSTSTNFSQTIVVTYFFADIPLSGLDPTQAPAVNAVACDYSYYGAQQNPLGFGCPASEPTGTTCAPSGYAWPSDVGCAPAAVYQGPGHAVVYCGFKETVTQNDNGVTSTTNYGSQASTVYLRMQ